MTSRGAHLTTLAVALCLVLSACTASPADRLRADVDRLSATVAGIDGVAEVGDTLGSGATDGTEAAERTWVQLSVRTEVADAPAFAAAARSVGAALAGEARVTARVWQAEDTAVPALAAEVTGAHDDVTTTGALAALAEVDGVVSVQVLPDSASVTVTEAAQLPAVARLTSRLRLDAVSLSTPAQRVTGTAAPRLLDERVAGLVADVDGRPGVTSIYLSDDGGDEVRLRVLVQGDDTVAELAQVLATTPWPEDAGAVHAVVASSFREQGVVVGRPEPAAAPEATPAPASPWPDDPAAPACPGDGLEVRLAGYDVALGRRFLLLTAINRSAAACAVEGRPQMTFRRASGTDVPDVETGTPTGTPPPPRLVVPPGEVVHAQLTWRGMSTALDPDVTQTLLVTAVPGAAPVALDAGEGGLDVLAGAAVEIGAWTPGASWDG
ncbi:DUF4232 domain-containing protein [Cellulomonas sp. Marseille-Q8402]